MKWRCEPPHKPDGTGELFTAGAMAIGITYARDLTDQFSIGFNAKYLREHLWNIPAAVAIDIGTIYRIPVLNEFRLAASISNFGTKMKLEGRDNLKIAQVGGGDGNLINTDVQLDECDLPLVFRVGVAADVVKAEEWRLTAEVDAVHPNDNTEYLNTGRGIRLERDRLPAGRLEVPLRARDRAALHGGHRAPLPFRGIDWRDRRLRLSGLGSVEISAIPDVRCSVLARDRHAGSI